MKLNDFLMLNVGFATHKGDWNFDNINSPFSRIYYVTEGSAVVEIFGEKHRLTAGNMYMIPSFTTHSDFCTGLFNHFYVHVYEESGYGEDFISSFDFPFEIKGCEMDRILFERLVSSNGEMGLKSSDPEKYDNEQSLIECVKANRNRPLAVRMESMGIIAQLISRFLGEAREKYYVSDLRIRQALRLIGSRLYGHVAIDELARKACMSEGHFIRLFKEEVGCTPARFLADRKMMRAKLMLASEPVRIKEVAAQLGYEDMSYFVRLFKKNVGITPGEYRRLYNPSSGR